MPPAVWNESFESYRRFLRAFLWIAVVVAVIALAIATAAFAQPTTPTSLPRTDPSGIEVFARFAFNIIAGIISLAHLVFMMLYLEQIGIPLNDRWIAGRAKLMVWLLRLPLVLFCTVIAPFVGIALQVQLYLLIRGGLGRVVAGST